jgi:Ca2+-binding EF-hand superfamily protein
MFLKCCFIVAFLLLATSGYSSAFAEEKNGFDVIDTDGNGNLNEDEFSKAAMVAIIFKLDKAGIEMNGDQALRARETVFNTFSKTDKNKDGKLSQEEYEKSFSK